jgi:hypothetical protein
MHLSMIICMPLILLVAGGDLFDLAPDLVDVRVYLLLQLLKVVLAQQRQQRVPRTALLPLNLLLLLLLHGVEGATDYQVRVEGIQGGFIRSGVQHIREVFLPRVQVVEILQ